MHMNLPTAGWAYSLQLSQKYPFWSSNSTLAKIMPLPPQATSSAISSSTMARSLRMNCKPVVNPCGYKWDPNTPIKTLFHNGVACHNFAINGDNPIPDA